jgi:hypothetical protein
MLHQFCLDFNILGVTAAPECFTADAVAVDAAEDEQQHPLLKLLLLPPYGAETQSAYELLEKAEANRQQQQQEEQQFEQDQEWQQQREQWQQQQWEEQQQWQQEQQQWQQEQQQLEQQGGLLSSPPLSDMPLQEWQQQQPALKHEVQQRRASDSDQEQRKQQQHHHMSKIYLLQQQQQQQQQRLASHAYAGATAATGTVFSAARSCHRRRSHSRRSRSRSRSRERRKHWTNSSTSVPLPAAGSISAGVAAAAAAAARAAAAQNATTAHPLSMTGDWRCPACSFKNYRWRTKCMKCSTCRPAAAAAADHARAGQAAAAAAAGGSSSDPWARQPVRDGWSTIRWVLHSGGALLVVNAGLALINVHLVEHLNACRQMCNILYCATVILVAS